MQPSGPPTTTHPLVAMLDRVEADLKTAAGLPAWTLDTATTAQVLHQLTRLESRVEAAKLAALAHAEVVDVAAPTGAASTASWLAHTTRTTHRRANAQTRLASSLEDTKHACVRDALSAGLIQVDQAETIVRAVDALPDDLDTEQVARAEAHLVEQAAHFDAKALRVLGDRLLEVIDPDLAEAHQARLLADQERKAAQQTRLTMTGGGHGSVFVRAKLPDRYAAMLKKILLGYAAPKHQAATAAQTGEPTPERRPSPERMGQAFCDFLESVTDGDLPQTGGTGATVVVTMDLDTLRGGLAAAHLDTGEPISPGEARRLACQAGIIPAVLDGASVPLDLGRTQRFHTRAQRVAIGLRDRGCTADGCDWPPGMCHIHHDPPWSHGGPTDITHARMLCPHHHARAHDPGYQHTRQTQRHPHLPPEDLSAEPAVARPPEVRGSRAGSPDRGNPRDLSSSRPPVLVSFGNGFESGPTDGRGEMGRQERDKAYVEFVAARQGALLRYAYLLCGDWHRAEDATAAALTRVYLAWPRIRREGAEEAFARTTLRRVLIDESRRPWRREEPTPTPPPSSSAPAADLGGGERALLLEALLSLSVKQRQCVALRYWLDLSIDDTARELGISPGSVKTHTRRALDHLRTHALLTPGGTDDP